VRKDCRLSLLPISEAEKPGPRQPQLEALRSPASAGRAIHREDWPQSD
jgi:hypothetical protein